MLYSSRTVCPDLQILEKIIFWCKLYGFDENDMKIIKIEYLKVIKQSKNYNYQRSENWKFEVRSQELLGKQVWDLTNNLLKWIGLDILNGFLNYRFHFGLKGQRSCPRLCLTWEVKVHIWKKFNIRLGNITEWIWCWYLWKFSKIKVDLRGQRLFLKDCTFHKGFYIDIMIHDCMTHLLW